MMGGTDHGSWADNPGSDYWLESDHTAAMAQERADDTPYAIRMYSRVFAWLARFFSRDVAPGLAHTSDRAGEDVRTLPLSRRGTR